MLPEYHPQNRLVEFLCLLDETHPACADHLCESLIDRMDQRNLLREYTDYMLHNGAAPIRVGSLITDVLGCSYDLIRMNVAESIRLAECARLIQHWRGVVVERRELGFRKLAA